MQTLQFKGRVWVFGDNISTDYLLPGFTLFEKLTPEERGKYCMHANRPGWAEQVEPGDIIVAGRNFGCGSSRAATLPLQGLGIQCVVAESVSRLFFRNSINLGFPLVICPGASEFFSEGDVADVDVERGIVRNVTQGTEIQGSPMPEGSPPMEILKKGGLGTVLKELAEKRRQDEEASERYDNESIGYLAEKPTD